MSIEELGALQTAEPDGTISVFDLREPMIAGDGLFAHKTLSNPGLEALRTAGVSGGRRQTLGGDRECLFARALGQFRQHIYLPFRVEFSPYKVRSFAGDYVLVSFKGNCVRGARFTRSRDAPFWETPEPMTTFAVSFMRNKTKNNAEM